MDHKLPLTGRDPVPQPRREAPVYTPPGGPPQNTSVSREIFGLMGEDNIRAMIASFYDRLAASEIAELFPKGDKNIQRAAEKSADFFVFLLGGPPLYQQRHGPPMMRARHMPFEIDDNARLVWLRCFKEAIADAVEKHGFPAQHRDGFEDFLDKFSTWMVNVGPSPQAP
ncbi:MAG: hypothetical protein AAFR38_01435 [Planctomycetota bacterium]